MNDGPSTNSSAAGGQKRCLVIGGTGALGRTVIRLLNEAGARVAFTFCSNEKVAQELTNLYPGFSAIRLDLRLTDDIDSAAARASKELGGLDALIFCAGLGTAPEDPVPLDAHPTMLDTSSLGWDSIMNVNLKGAFFACRAAAQFMHLPEGGNIVLLGSVDGIKTVPAPVAYAAAKGALSAMARAMAKELGPRNIRSVVIAPGIIEDGLSRSVPSSLLKEYLKHCGLKRKSTLEEAANLVVWLALNNTYVTGQTIILDGAL